MINIKNYANNIINKINRKIVFTDVETTGTDVTKDEIIQFGAIVIEPKKGINEYEFFIKPSFLVPQSAIDIHGITNEKLENQGSFGDYAKDIVAIFRDADIGGFNVRFDLQILDRQLEDSGYFGVFDQANIYDSFSIFKDHLPRNLGAAYKHYGFGELENAHDAMQDIKASLVVFSKQLDIENTEDPINISRKYNMSYDSRIGFSDHIIIKDGKPYINFGKHKGTELKMVDKSYLRWVVDKSDLPWKVKEYVKEYIKTN
jgi:DNA polymerase-3 subunit epsilon